MERYHYRGSTPKRWVVYDSRVHGDVTVEYAELDSDGYPVGEAIFREPEHVATRASSLAEVADAWLADPPSGPWDLSKGYERRFGGVCDQPIQSWDPHVIAACVDVHRDEFERVWREARAQLESRP